MASVCPANNKTIAEVTSVSLAEYSSTVEAAVEAWDKFVELTAPHRGEIVRQIGEALREKKTQLGKLIALEMGKIVSEGEGISRAFQKIKRKFESEILRAELRILLRT